MTTEIQGITCPLCKAGPGEPCRTSGGNVLPHTHVRRYNELNRWRRETKTVVRMKDAFEPLGFHEGNLILVLGWAKGGILTVIGRLSDGVSGEGTALERNRVDFVREATERDMRLFASPVLTAPEYPEPPNPWKNIPVPVMAAAPLLAKGIQDEQTLLGLPQGAVVRFPMSSNVAVKADVDHDFWVVGGHSRGFSSRRIADTFEGCDVIWLPSA